MGWDRARPALLADDHRSSHPHSLAPSRPQTCCCNSRRAHSLTTPARLVPTFAIRPPRKRMHGSHLLAPASSSFVDRRLGVVFSPFLLFPSPARLTQPLTPVSPAPPSLHPPPFPPAAATIAAVGSSQSTPSPSPPESRSRIELRNSVHCSPTRRPYSPNLGPLTSPPSPSPKSSPTPPAVFLVPQSRASSAPKPKEREPSKHPAAAAANGFGQAFGLLEPDLCSTQASYRRR